jgi:hypothetical protein
MSQRKGKAMQCVVCDAQAAGCLDGWERLDPKFSDSRAVYLCQPCSTGLRSHLGNPG